MNVARRLRLGRLVYLGWHLPLAWLARSRREGGPLNQLVNWRGRVSMKRAAAEPPPRPRPAANAPEVCFLTGKNFWYQTAFCCWSLCHASGREFTPVFLDDGTFDSSLRRECLRVFPGAKLVEGSQTVAHLDNCLPAEAFP